jgi:hypothetical protein
MTQDRDRLYGFVGMVTSAGLSLVIILFLAAVQSADAYAEFTQGMIFGGIVAVFLGFAWRETVR